MVYNPAMTNVNSNLNDSIKKVYRSVPQGLEVVSAVVLDINKRFRLIDADLERIAVDILVAMHSSGFARYYQVLTSWKQ